MCDNERRNNFLLASAHTFGLHTAWIIILNVNNNIIRIVARYLCERYRYCMLAAEQREVRQTEKEAKRKQTIEGSQTTLLREQKEVTRQRANKKIFFESRGHKDTAIS